MRCSGISEIDLQSFLQAAGAQVEGAGTSTITIQGGLPLHPVEYRVMGDRIAAATYLCARRFLSRAW